MRTRVHTYLSFLSLLKPQAPTLALGCLVAVLYVSFLAHRIDLTVADLGRHLTNGKMLLEQGIIPATNFYSYTMPDAPAINHHWGSGLLFFLAWKAGGFTAVHLLFIAVSAATLAVFFGVAAAAAGPGPAAVITALAVPLLAERTEVRPEAFSYLCAALFFLILLRYEKAGRRRALAILPFIEILWVNTHIYFFLGPVLVAAFLAGGVVRRPFDWSRVVPLGYAFLATAAAAFINPFGAKGAFAPFTIFQNYGYRVAENQPVWFVETLMRNPNFTIFKVLFLLLAASFIARLWIARRSRASVSLALIGAMVSASAWLATRNFALFGFFFVPIVAMNLAACSESVLAARRRVLAAAAATLVLFLMAPAFFGQWQRYFPYWKEAGLGLERGNGDAAAFFLAQDVHGPIFNNYDIGGYLIWRLFPKERVFVDNRPEAYTEEFFRTIYIPTQEREDAWQRAIGRWQFNVIFFSHRDMTPWAQQFLVARVHDPAWAPVYADRYAIIFLRRNDKNKSLIEKFEIPQSAFRIVRQ